MLSIASPLVRATLAAASFAAPALMAVSVEPIRPVPLNEATQRITMPDGFHVSLFAGEPEVVQPIAMTTDERGRLWVVEWRFVANCVIKHLFHVIPGARYERMYGQDNSEEKADAISTLASRSNFAVALLEAVKRRAVPAKDISAFTARQIQALKDARIAPLMKATLGGIRSVSKDPAAQIEQYKRRLTPEEIIDLVAYLQSPSQVSLPSAE